MRAKIAPIFILLATQLGCDVDLGSRSGTATNNTVSEDQRIKKIKIGSDALDAIKVQIAGHPPMRGGYLLGDKKNGVAEIRYFLYDYDSPSSGGSYIPGASVDQNLAIADAYKLIDKPLLKTFLGLVLSSPGSLSYVLGSNEANIDKFFEKNPQINSYIYAVVTMGPETMRTVEAHELKLSDNAKMSFYVKERGEKIAPFTNFEVYQTNSYDYQKMNAYISALAHAADMIRELNLKNLGLTRASLRELPKPDHYSVEFDFGKKLSIIVALDSSYPATAPEIGCYPKDATGKLMSPTAKAKPANWRPNDQDPKNFYNFFNDFITNKCRPQDFN